MRRNARGLMALIVAAAAMVGAVAWAYSVWRSSQRNDMASFGQYAIALALLVGSVIASARRWRTNVHREVEPSSTAELNELADQLAETVKDEWTTAASNQGLLVPEPIPVQWRRPSVAITGPVSAAVDTQLFQPLPGMTAATAERLKEGEIHDLHELYAGVGSGRLVIVGAPGSGKSGAAILLILAALRYRENVKEADRPKAPVPVMLTFHGWNPDVQPIQDWLAVELSQTYPQLRGRNGAVKAALLLTTGKIAVILDGLDEISPKLQPIALRALNQQAKFRLVVLARRDEMVAAAAKGHLEGAAAIELRNIDAITAADYLTRVQVDPPPFGWNELTEGLRHSPDAPIAVALNTPLTLTLVRDTYREGDSVRELLDFRVSGRRAFPSEIVDHLLDRVIPSAYTQRPGQPPLKYNLETVQPALRHIAARMNQDKTYDLRWWLIPTWEPSRPRVLATGLVAGFASAVAVGIVTWFAAGARVGVAIGAVTGAVTGALTGVLSSGGGRGGGTPERIGPVAWRNAVRGKGLAIGVAAGVAVGFFAALLAGVAAGVAVGIAVGIAMGPVIALGQEDTDNSSPFTPLTTWRNDWTYTFVVGAASGVALGMMYGVVAGVFAGVVAGVFAGLVAGTLSCLVIGPMISEMWPTSLACIQLAKRWDAPIRIMSLLEDARHKGILRTIGPVYQFRHGRLQDRLAEQAPAVPQNATSAAAVANTVAKPPDND